MLVIRVLCTQNVAGATMALEISQMQRESKVPKTESDPKYFCDDPYTFCDLLKCDSYHKVGYNIWVQKSQFLSFFKKKHLHLANDIPGMSLWNNVIME